MLVPGLSCFHGCGVSSALHLLTWLIHWVNIEVLIGPCARGKRNSDEHVGHKACLSGAPTDWRVWLISQLDGAVLHVMLSSEEGSKMISWRKGCLIPSLKDESSRNQEWGWGRKEGKKTTRTSRRHVPRLGGEREWPLQHRYKLVQLECKVCSHAEQRRGCSEDSSSRAPHTRPKYMTLTLRARGSHWGVNNRVTKPDLCRTEDKVGQEVGSEEETLKSRSQFRSDETLEWAQGTCSLPIWRPYGLMSPLPESILILGCRNRSQSITWGFRGAWLAPGLEKSSEALGIEERMARVKVSSRQTLLCSVRYLCFALPPSARGPPFVSLYPGYTPWGKKVSAHCCQPMIPKTIRSYPQKLLQEKIPGRKQNNRWGAFCPMATRPHV